MRIRAVYVAAGLGLLYAARRYYRNWNTVKGECRMTLPGDELVGQPTSVTTEAIDIDVPASTAWPSVLRIATRSERRTLSDGDEIHLTPDGLPWLDGGVTLQVERVIEGAALVLRAMPDSAWPVVMSFHLLPRGQDRCRLLLRTRTPLRRPGQVFLVEMAGPPLAAFAHALLVAAKRSAENSDPSGSPAAPGVQAVAL